MSLSTRLCFTIVLLALLPLLLQAQAFDRNRNFSFDSTFRIGAHDLPLARLARDTFRLDFVFLFQTDIQNLRRQLNDPLTGDFADTLARTLYRQADTLANRGSDPTWRDTAGLKVIIIPDRFSQLHDGVRAVDNYVHVDSAQFFGFHERGAGTMQKLSQTSFIYTYRVADTTPATSQLIVSGPRYLSTEAFRLGDANDYSAIGISTDSIRYLRVGFHMRADSLQNLGDADTLAYAILYRRYPDNTGCGCAIYEPFYRFAITKELYNNLDSTPTISDPSGGFKDAGFWLDMRGGRIQQGEYAYHSKLGGWLGREVASSPCAQTCQALLLRLRDTLGTIVAGSYNAGAPVDESDIHFSLYTTRKVPITLLRTRVSMHEYEVFKQGRFDAWLKQDIDSLWMQPGLALARRRLLRIGVYDEPGYAVLPASERLIEKAQDWINARSPNNKLGLFHNPPTNFDGYRILMGDLDTTKLRRVHQMSRQLFSAVAGRIPVRYANPDYMDDTALVRFYAKADTGRWVDGTHYDLPRMIAYNTEADYEAYTQRAQDEGFGKYLDRWDPNLPVQGPLVPWLARAVDAARFKYESFRAGGAPVWSVIQVMGWLPEAASQSLPSHGYIGAWSVRPATPEEITAQAWLSLNGGAQGIEYSSIVFDGADVGVVDWRIGTGRVDWSKNFSQLGNGEYDTARGNHPNYMSNPNWILPKMWLGFRSRFEAVRNVNQAIRRIDTVYSKLVYRQEQLSAHDTLQPYATFPLFDTLWARHAQRYEHGSGGSFLDSAATDARPKTYLEITHFVPGWRDSTNQKKGARYLLVTNRRVWPIDTLTYTTRTTQLNGLGTSADRGFGNRDVRHPVLRVKNSSEIMADSFLVEKVGDESVYNRRVRIGDTVQLDWLKPGEGALYRFIPIAYGVSNRGVAFNNAVRAENPSQGSTTDMKKRLTVYERDGLIYLRTIDGAGTWSKELRLSDRTSRSADTTDVNPALATVRNGTSCLIVWERRIKTSAQNFVTSTIQARRLAGPTFDSASVATSSRAQVGGTKTFNDTTWFLAPAVAGLQGGYAVAYGSSNGIDIVGLRDASLTSANVASTTGNVKATTINAYNQTNYAVAGNSFFPTLAYVRNATALSTGFGLDTFQITHLAWQQGIPNMANSQFILYKPFGVKIPATGVPTLYLSTATHPIEHVSKSLNGCGFLHPSIAADSIWIAVAFQTNSQATRLTTLRFRDTNRLGPNGTWSSLYYAWGGWDQSRLKNRYYEWPSVTEFPKIARASVRNATGRPQGALVWYQTNSPGNIAEQRLYRYGWDTPQRMPAGQYPTMVLAPHQMVDPFPTTGVLYRGDTSQRFTRPFPSGGGAGTYYPAYLLNVPSNRSALFGIPSPNTYLKGETQIFANGVTDCLTIYPQRQLTYGFSYRFEERDDEGFPIIPSDLPSIPPSFFANPIDGETSVETIAEAAKVVRSSVFARATGPIPIIRTFAGSDSLTQWLIDAPRNGGDTADIKIITELVRVSDSAVVWISDTISARRVGSDTLREELLVPSDTVGPGVEIFVRMRAEPSPGLDYDFNAGFHFLEDSTVTTFYRPFRRQRRIPEGVEESELSIVVAPNPIRSSAELTIASLHEGTARITVHDAMGRIVLAILPIRMSKPGEYTVPIALDGLPSGTYTVRAETALAHAVAHIQYIP